MSSHESKSASGPVPSGDPAARGGRSRRLAFALPPVAGAGLVYLNALHNPFVWDDFHTVADNRSLDTLWNLRGVLLQDVSRPLVNLSFAVDRAVWGAAPFGFHVSSVLLHMLNVLLLFLLVERVTEDAEQGRAPARPRPEIVAAIAAWLFAVHPMMSEAVGYISGRADVLSATFVLAAFLALRQWSWDGGRGWLVAGGAACAAALASKETAMVLPLLLGSYLASAGASLPPEARRRLTRAAVSFGLIIAILGGLRLGLLLSVEHPGHTGFHWRHVLVDLDVVRLYAGLLVTPGGQSVFHPVVSIGSLWEWRALAGVLFTAGLVGVAWTLRRRAGVAGLGILWFLIALVPPAILVLFDLGHPMAEHRTYLANAGLFMAAGFAVGWLCAWVRPGFGLRRLVPVALVLAPVTLAGQTLVRNAMWSDPRVLWLEAVDRAPDIWLPHLLLGEALRDRGMREEAVVAFRNAVRLRPDNADAYLKLGVCLTEIGRLDEAGAVFSDLQRAVPASPVAAEGLGTIAMLTGRMDQARGYFGEALRVDPGNIAARQSLALLSEQEAKPAEALRWCQEIESLAPGTAGAAECVRRNSSRLPPAS